MTWTLMRGRMTAKMSRDFSDNLSMNLNPFSCPCNQSHLDLFFPLEYLLIKQQFEYI